MTIREIPNVDFSKIPDEFEGKWLLVRVGEDQEVVASARTPEAAMSARPDLEHDPLVVLTKAPKHLPVAAITRSKKHEL